MKASMPKVGDDEDDIEEYGDEDAEDAQINQPTYRYAVAKELSRGFLTDGRTSRATGLRSAPQSR